MINFYNQKSLAFSEKSQYLNTFSLHSAQSGRSMIEMLGVLAIIGVLSVGGIAGYSKAMTKFKINKTIDQVSHIVANIRTLYASQPNYYGLNPTILKKAHLVPDDMWSGSSTNLVNAFGGRVIVDYDRKASVNTDDWKAFTVAYYDIPEDACIELATQDWGAATGSGLMAVSVGNGTPQMDNYLHCNGGTGNNYTTACPNGSNISVPMPIAAAAEACSGSTNTFVIKYY